MEDYRKYLLPENLAKIDNLELIARLVVEGFITGLHRSPYHGFSVEFAEHRQYRPGDEIRRLDWKVFARSEKYYIKQFEEETNLRAMLVVDSSASMKYASKGNISKYEYATYLAASLAYLLINQRDAVGLSLYDTDIRHFMPMKSKQSYLSEVIKMLANGMEEAKNEDSAKDEQPGTAAVALDEIAERLGRRGLVVIISDFFDNTHDILKAISHFRHKNHDVIVFHILDPREMDFKFGPAAQFIDLETREEMVTQPQQIQKAYVTAMQNFTQDFKKGCRNLNVDYNLTLTNSPFDKALREFIAKRGKM